MLVASWLAVCFATNVTSWFVTLIATLRHRFWRLAQNGLIVLYRVVVTVQRQVILLFSLDVTGRFLGGYCQF
jgi:hypothetical protein